ncbi:hypothetical protein AB0C70_39600 [Streptomyces sp. NPDC048564]|uniref:hypothetical protein n=1 Tax=Streptomyces sp. NPDC048564 TaxID=3155760 RepID=UPI0034183C48
MARPARKPAAPTKPLTKPPVRIGRLDAAAIIGELRKLHEDAEDPDIGQMAADAELFQALLYLESHASALKDERARRMAAVRRVLLWEYLREQADLHQSKAIDQARAAGVAWAELAPALAVNATSAAYNKARRLQATVLTEASVVEGPVRRTPEAVHKVEQQAAARAAAELRAQQEAVRRHQLLAPVAHRLIEHRVGLDDNDDVTYWLDQIASVLPSCQTPTQILSLETYVAAAVRELKKAERATGLLAATTTDAQLAYAAAAEVVSR